MKTFCSQGAAYKFSYLFTYNWSEKHVGCFKKLLSQTVCHAT